jgi:hypothetical protein
MIGLDGKLPWTWGLSATRGVLGRAGLYGWETLAGAAHYRGLFQDIA